MKTKKMKKFVELEINVKKEKKMDIKIKINSIYEQTSSKKSKNFGRIKPLFLLFKLKFVNI